jgi:aminoglycoside 3-N-acetyltransferase
MNLREESMAANAEPIQTLATIPTMVNDLKALGVKSGMVLLAHSSMKAIGYVNGGAPAVILALEEALSNEGTLVMPTHTADYSDPKDWKNPPAPEEWWQTIRDTMPAFDAALTTTYGMGVIPETFRKQSGVLRSNHPYGSFAAWGKHAQQVTDHHTLSTTFGDGSPLARVYDLDGWVLLIGVGHANNTSLHLAEERASIPRIDLPTGSPMMVNGKREWVKWVDVEFSDSDFERLGADFARQTGLQKEGIIGQAKSLLMPQRALIDYGVGWLEKNRK